MVMEKRRLGKGLDALVGSAGNGHDVANPSATVSVEHIRQNPFQPRKSFDSD